MMSGISTLGSILRGTSSQTNPMKESKEDARTVDQISTPDLIRILYARLGLLEKKRDELKAALDGKTAFLVQHRVGDSPHSLQKDVVVYTEEMLEERYCKDHIAISNIDGVTLFSSGNDGMLVGLANLNDDRAKKAVLAVLSDIKVDFIQFSELTAQASSSLGEDEEENEGSAYDLFTNQPCASPAEAIKRALDQYKFDLVSFVKSRLVEDPLAMARTVNYLRQQSEQDKQKVVDKVVSNENDWWHDDEFLRPVLPDDALLWWGDAFSEAEDGELIDEEEEDEEAAEEEVQEKEEEEDYYFESYGQLAIHEEMLRDDVRTNAYRNAFLQTRDELLKGKIVMDVGCGTGILSMLCSKEGHAAKVYAIEASKNAAKLCASILSANGFTSKQIHLFNGKLEDFVLLDKQLGKKVDALVSEWMGYALLYESMFESVLLARDQFLAPGGRMYPNRARILIEAVRDVEGRLSFWDDVYGFDYSAARAKRMNQVDVVSLTGDSVVSNRIVLQDFDLETITQNELDFVSEFELDVTADTVDGLCLSFDCFFPNDDDTGKASLSTTPSDPYTHWKQSVLWFNAPMTFGAPQGEQGKLRKIKGTIGFTRRLKTNRREYDMLLRLTEPEVTETKYGMG